MDQCATLGPHEHTHYHGRRFSWSAIIIGALVGVGFGFLLNLFSVAIGLSAYTNDKAGMTTLAVGGLVGLLIGTIASMFVMGWIAGYLGRPCGTKSWYGVLYGFGAWCLSLVLSVLLATSIGNFVSNYSDFIAHPGSQVAYNPANPRALEVKDTETGRKSTVNTEKAANQMGMQAFVIFILFFVGALSAAFGGGCGYACRVDEREIVT